MYPNGVAGSADAPPAVPTVVAVVPPIATSPTDTVGAPPINFNAPLDVIADIKVPVLFFHSTRLELCEAYP